MKRSKKEGTRPPSTLRGAKGERKRPRKKKVWLAEQETKYSCGPASLKYALCVLGFSPREEHLRRLARSTWRGTQTTQLLAAARRFGLRPRLKVFAHDDWEHARIWLEGELRDGRPVILDVEGFQHYVCAVQSLLGSVVVIDPEGANETMDGSEYAQVVLANDRRLKRWWLCGDEPGEPETFRGISLEWPVDEAEYRRGTPRPSRERLFFSEQAIRRYQEGRFWILDEYLIDVVDIVLGTAHVDGPMRPLGDLVRDLGGRWIATRVAYWAEATPAEIQMAKAHVEDIAVAAEAMDLVVPKGNEAKMRVSADVASLLMAMLSSRE